MLGKQREKKHNKGGKTIGGKIDDDMEVGVCVFGDFSVMG